MAPQPRCSLHELDERCGSILSLRDRWPSDVAAEKSLIL